MAKFLSTLLLSMLLAFSTASFAADATATQDLASVAQSVNINSADVNELAQLKGIGSTKAQAIIDYRESQGPFASIKDIVKVKGIGEKIYLDNQSRMTVE